MDLSNETFYLDNLKSKDALSLNQLMIRNARHFQQYLPKTLAQNLSEDASKNYIKNKSEAFKNKTEFTFAIKEKSTHNIAGLVILKNLDWNTKQGEFAYCLGNKYSGNGWMSKSVQAAKNYAFNKLGLEKLQVIIHHTNTDSINVAKRSGFTWVKTLKKEHVSAKAVLDMELYEAKNDV
ncbi:GNAT family N-acetyltransferase [Mangrovimonas spongiae]|uniref:N-acetyltransferase n=1 Tax=Mangrovimonas spongiae TaxID=2494697 RepID=A0A3R9MGB6_9FLAO|nr:GNAT family N-acetyltransferase [Mangrovimonas spongiae]RSK41447.1 N-acetyltransferase [Mangrovimonas spongiae]